MTNTEMNTHEIVQKLNKSSKKMKTNYGENENIDLTLPTNGFHAPRCKVAGGTYYLPL